ncbi:MAG: 50S ribosomal protein L28 [Bacteroidota bacterium]|nr:50S ribosomal protein L28 [Bacteroidota bacterium]
MAKLCEITGKGMMTGHKVSHSNVKTKRWFYPNLHKKKFYIPEEDKWITLIVSADGIRTINKKGILNAMKVAREKGYTKQ